MVVVVVPVPVVVGGTPLQCPWAMAGPQTPFPLRRSSGRASTHTPCKLAWDWVWTWLRGRLAQGVAVGCWQAFRQRSQPMWRSSSVSKSGLKQDTMGLLPSGSTMGTSCERCGSLPSPGWGLGRVEEWSASATHEPWVPQRLLRRL